MKPFSLRWPALLASALALAVAAAAAAQDAAPAAAQSAAAQSAAIEVERVEFASLDDARTPLVGYLFKPAGVAAGKAPAVVLMHGRAGAYSSLAKGVYDAKTLTQRHRWWARHWAEQGYYALVVDGFGPRGYPGGFAAGTYKDRPDSINEVAVRPLDAYGALKYLRTRPEIAGDRVGLMGWSNGGSAALATMADDKPGDMRKLGFKAALAFYPGCGLKRAFERNGYKAYAPVLVFMGTADEEVSPALCEKFVARSKGLASPIDLVVYPDATHGFDDPGKKRQGVPANAAAAADARARADRFFAEHLAPSN